MALKIDATITRCKRGRLFSGMRLYTVANNSKTKQAIKTAMPAAGTKNALTKLKMKGMHKRHLGNKTRSL